MKRIRGCVSNFILDVVYKMKFSNSVPVSETFILLSCRILSLSNLFLLLLTNFLSKHRFESNAYISVFQDKKSNEWYSYLPHFHVVRYELITIIDPLSLKGQSMPLRRSSDDQICLSAAFSSKMKHVPPSSIKHVFHLARSARHLAGWCRIWLLYMSQSLFGRISKVPKQRDKKA